jgi:uncharacterized protein (TIGR02996 family)
MTVEAGLLQAICEAPDDDTPRLIYADWLDDHGQPERAEFIRLQIELANLPAKRTKKRRQELERQIESLWREHGLTWSGNIENGLLAWERGFCSFYSADDITELSRGLPQRVMEVPIQTVGLNRTTPAALAHLVAMACLVHVRKLILDTTWTVSSDKPLTDAHIPLLTNCPHLARLERLNLTFQQIGPPGIRLLANAEKLPALCELDLYANECGDVGLGHIATSPMAARLRKIYLTGVRTAPITAEGMRILATTPLPCLRSLRLESDRIRDAGARHLAGTLFPKLTELYLNECGLTDAGVKAIASSPHLKNLELLDLSSNWTVGHAGVVALVESPYLKHLRYLDLWRCERISEDDEKMLRKRFRSRVNFARSY